MKPRKAKDEGMRVLRLWTLGEVAKAGPYLRGVISSLREHWLDVLTSQRNLDRISARKGRPDRDLIIRTDEQKELRDRAQSKFESALEELSGLDVFLLDPVQGLALIPFRKNDDLAWYVFDLFSDEGLVGWRLHDDSFETCRPLTELEEPVSNGTNAN